MENINKFKKLGKNSLIFTISGFASSLLSFALLPLYTAYMTTSDYGISDLVSTTVELLIPIFTLNISSAVLRFSFDNENHGKKECNIGIMVVGGGFIALLACYPILVRLNLFTHYIALFYLCYITNALYTMFSSVAKANNKIKWIGIIGIVKTLLAILLNILFIVVFRWGVFGYLLTNVISSGISIMILLFVTKDHLSFFPTKMDLRLLRYMVLFCLPLIPNNLCWWLVNSANKYIINTYVSTSELGLYSVASKIPTIINVVQNILSQALVLSVLEEYKDKSTNNDFFTDLYNLYNTILLVVCSILVFATKIIAKILFSAEFFEGWRYVPLLCIASVFGGMAGYIGTFYSASKKNTGIFVSTVIGAASTLILSNILIRSIGIIGVPISSVCSYMLIWLYRVIDTRKYVTINYRVKRDALSYGLLFAQTLILFCGNGFIPYGMNAALLIAIVCLNLDSIQKMFDIFRTFIREKMRKEDME